MAKFFKPSPFTGMCLLSCRHPKCHGDKLENILYLSSLGKNEWKQNAENLPAKIVFSVFRPLSNERKRQLKFLVIVSLQRHNSSSQYFGSSNARQLKRDFA